MTTEEMGKIIETNSMMDALGFKPITQEEKPDGIYVTYLLPTVIKATTTTILEKGLPAAQ